MHYSTNENNKHLLKKKMHPFLVHLITLKMKLFPTVNLIKTSQLYEIYSILLPPCAVAMTVRALCMVCYVAFGCDFNPNSKLLLSIFNYTNKA
jgi:hypothetical protein